MSEPRNEYGFPLCEPQTSYEMFVAMLSRNPGGVFIGYGSKPKPTKLELAQAYAADVRARRGMVVRKGFYLDLIK